MNKRKNDAFIRNRRPMIQSTIPAPKRTIPKKGFKVRILHNDNDIELARRAMACLVSNGYLCELIEE